MYFSHLYSVGLRSHTLHEKTNGQDVYMGGYDLHDGAFGLRS